MGPQVTDILIVGDNEIYCSISSPNGVMRSINNGETFELVNNGLPSGMMRDLTSDNDGFIYVCNLAYLAKSINPVVSVKENQNDNYFGGLSIYPNPTCSELYLNTINPNLIGQEVFIQILDMRGNVLHHSSFTFDTMQHQLNLDILSTGLYLIRFQLHDKVQQTKLVKY